jgi:MFS family permease
MTLPPGTDERHGGAGRPAAPGRALRTVRRARSEMRAFPRQFWLLALGFFLLLIGIDMCFPFETTYLHDRLGYSMTTIGLLLGVPLLVAIPLYVVDGAIADRYGRKPAIVAGISFVIALYVTLAFAGQLWQIAIAVSAEAAFGWALFLTASNAMVADLVPFERRAEAYSITRVALHAGMVVGPLLAALVLAYDPTYRFLFLAGAAICLVFVAVVLIFFRETRPAAARSGGSLATTMRGYGTVLHDRRFLAFCAVAALPFYGFGQIWSTLPVMLRNEHGVSPRQWAFILAFYALSLAIFQYPVIRLLLKRDHILLMATASLLVGLGLAGAVLVPWGPLTFVSVFVLGQGVLLLIPIASTVSAELAPVALRGRYMGTWTLVQMGGYALGPLLGGWAMDGLGERGAALVIAGCGTTGALLYVGLARRFRTTAPVDIIE